MSLLARLGVASPAELNLVPQLALRVVLADATHEFEALCEAIACAHGDGVSRGLQLLTASRLAAEAQVPFADAVPPPVPYALASEFGGASDEALVRATRDAWMDDLLLEAPTSRAESPYAQGLRAMLTFDDAWVATPERFERMVRVWNALHPGSLVPCDAKGAELGNEMTSESIRTTEWFAVPLFGAFQSARAGPWVFPTAWWVPYTMHPLFVYSHQDSVDGRTFPPPVWCQRNTRVARAPIGEVRMVSAERLAWRPERAFMFQVLLQARAHALGGRLGPWDYRTIPRDLPGWHPPMTLNTDAVKVIIETYLEGGAVEQLRVAPCHRRFLDEFFLRRSMPKYPDRYDLFVLIRAAGVQSDPRFLAALRLACARYGNEARRREGEYTRDRILHAEEPRLVCKGCATRQKEGGCPMMLRDLEDLGKGDAGTRCGRALGSGKRVRTPMTWIG